MVKCKRCSEEKELSEFYKNDKTCKTCRRYLVRINREKRKDYYREYDKKRYKEDPRVKERHKRYQATEAGKASAAKSRKAWAERNTIKRAANVIVCNAVRDGVLSKPSECSECGKSGVRIHGHHDDYAYPLTVRWLCSWCHNKWHKENGEGANG